MFSCILTGIGTTAFILAVYLIGNAICFILNKTDRINILSLYATLFTVGVAYMLVSYAYMIYNNYEYLLAFDIYNVFHPNAKKLLDLGNYLFALESIWGEYMFLSRLESGYFTYATTFAYIADYFNADFYLGQNTSVLFLYSFVGVLLYKLILSSGLPRIKAYKYTLIISFCSVIFFYSFQTLRDTHILLIYLSAIYLTYKSNFSIANLCAIITLSLLCCTFRVESGLFLFILIPTYLLLTLKQSKQKYIVVGVSIFITIIGYIIIVHLFANILQIAEANHEAYSADVTQGTGVISMFQRIPFIGDILSIIYNALQPLPFWSRFSYGPQSKYGGEVYNILNFPRAIATLFHCFVIVCICYWFLNASLRRKINRLINTPLKYQLLIGFVYLFIQSAVISQRRLMPYYAIYYILFFIIYSNMNMTEKKQANLTVIGVYISLQIFGWLYLF